MVSPVTAPETNTTLTVVKVNEANGGSNSDVNMTVEEIHNPAIKTNGISTEPAEHHSEHHIDPVDPILANLDKESVEKIEHALQAEQAGGLQLFDAGLEDLLDPELTGGDKTREAKLGKVTQLLKLFSDPDEETETVVSLDHCYSAAKAGQAASVARNAADSEVDSQSDSQSAPQSSGGSKGNPKRRSQRQIDRQEQEELRKIRAENEKLLRKEKEVLMRKDLPPQDSTTTATTEGDEKPVAVPSTTSDTPPTVNRSTAIRQKLQQEILNVEPLTSDKGGVARPRRENRQPPKHLRDAFNQLEFEAATSSVKKGDDVERHEMDAGSAGEDEGGEEEEEEDEDPDKLWCICRQPHNNRFMIGCDKCDEWFHGTCVGITRAMGRELEEKGLEWICAKCVKEDLKGQVPVSFVCLPTKQDPLMKNPFLLFQDLGPNASPGKKRRAEKSVEARARDPFVVLVDCKDKKGTKPAAKQQQQQHQQAPPVKRIKSPETSPPIRRPCVASGCRNDARANQVYCSDGCIVAHARDSLVAMSKLEAASAAAAPASPSTPSTPGKLMESLEFAQLMSQTTPSSAKSKALKKPANLSDDTPVPVIDRKTGKILAGASAPKVGNLEQWLKENPTYEVVKPTTLPSKVARQNSRPAAAATPSSSSTSSSLPGTPTSQQAPSPAGGPSTPSSASKSSGQKKQPDKPKLTRKRSLETGKEEDCPKKAAQPDPESTRHSAKASLKDVLWNRCKEAEDLAGKVTEADVEALAGEIEEALYRHFNKDTGQKYKTKFRSLIFNLKDTKNLGLFRQVAERQIIPTRLVRMTAEELASKELAEWRERETKHQLDMIQKTEMELMNMSNKVLVKTHKGEEVIEETGRELALEAERSETAILSSDVGAAGESGSAALAEGGALEILQDTTDRHGTHHFDLNCRICSGQLKEGDHDAQGVQAKTPETPQKASKSSSSSSSRHHHHHHHHHSSSSSSSGKKKSKESSHKDRDRRNSSSSSSKGRGSSHRSSHHSSSSSSSKHHRADKDKDRKKDKAEADGKKEEEVPAPVTTVEPEASTPSETTTDKMEGVVSQSSEAAAVPAADPPAPPSPVKQEPTSTVSIKTPEEASTTSPPSPTPPPAPASSSSSQADPPESFWKGVINSSEGKINVSASEFNEQNDLASLELPPQLDIVGRIRPEQVWDYLSQTRRSGSRDMFVFRFSPPPATAGSGSDPQEREAFSAYLRRLHKSDRFAVVGNHSKLVKDFYIIPLPKDSPVPIALSSLGLSKLARDENRTHMLLGVVVLVQKKKRSGSAGAGDKPAKLAKTLLKGQTSSSSLSPSSSGATPPGVSSPSTSLYIPTARRPSAQTPKDDVPYSPGQLLDEDDDEDGNGTKAESADEILKQKEMLEELNRKIAEEKQKLAVLTAEGAESSSAAGDGGVVIPGLGEPVIPGLGEPSWVGRDVRVTPSTDPPFEHPATAAAPLNLNLSNLQVMKVALKVLRTLTKLMALYVAGNHQHDPKEGAGAEEAQGAAHSVPSEASPSSSAASAAASGGAFLSSRRGHEDPPSAGGHSGTRIHQDQQQQREELLAQPNVGRGAPGQSHGDGDGAVRPIRRSGQRSTAFAAHPVPSLLPPVRWTSWARDAHARDGHDEPPSSSSSASQGRTSPGPALLQQSPRHWWRRRALPTAGTVPRP